MSRLRRMVLGLAVCLVGGIALHLADHTSSSDHARDVEIAKADTDKLNLGDCLLGHSDPSWPASYQAMCADLAQGRDIDPDKTDPDKDVVAPKATPASMPATAEVNTLGLRETTAAPAPRPISKAKAPKPEAMTSAKPVPVKLDNAAPAEPAPACLVDERGATTLRKASLSRVLPPKLAQQKTTGLRQPGVALIVEADCMVTSPVEGKVLYSGDFKGYRGVVIIRLTSGNQLIIAGLDDLKVKRGARVMRGTHLGTTSGDRAPALASTYGAETTSSLLYFDLRNAKGTGETVSWLPQAG